MRLWALACVSALALPACTRGTPGDLPDAPASPQAHAEPAPLANAPPEGDANGPARDAGPPPVPMRGDREMEVDVPRETARDVVRETTWRDGGPQVAVAPAATSKEPVLTGWEMQAVLRPSDVPAPPKAPEVATAAIEQLRKKMEARVAVAFSQTRARFVFASPGLAVPAQTELRARVDRYGWVLLWPGDDGADATTYRIAEAGALRALLGERRLDVAPLSTAEVVAGGPGATRLNVATRKYEVSTRAAKATFELATLKDSGDGGSLVCRALLDLMNAPPSTPLCATDQVPLFAELRWTTKGAVTFEAQSLAHRTDLPAAQLAAPPSGVAFVTAPPPAPPVAELLSRGELASFRTAAVEAPPAAPASPDAGARPPPLPNGLLVVNSTDELRVFLVDGVPAVWLAPGARDTLTAPLHGRYVVQWRTFLGDAFELPETVVVPGASEVGGADAGPS
jgi:hypothetical protein